MIKDLTDEELTDYIITKLLPKNLPLGSALVLIRPWTSKSDEEILSFIAAIKNKPTGPSKAVIKV